MVDDIMLQAEERMQGRSHSLGDNFASVRTGRANAMVLDRIRVDYYGVPTPVNQMAGIKTPDAHMLVIEPWDKGVLRAIEHAILESDLGVTPSNDGSVIRLPFPTLTEERRRELVKQCKGYAEEARVAVRNARQEANAAIERSVKQDSLPEDESAAPRPRSRSSPTSTWPRWTRPSRRRKPKSWRSRGSAGLRPAELLDAAKRRGAPSRGEAIARVPKYASPSPSRDLGAPRRFSLTY